MDLARYRTRFSDSLLLVARHPFHLGPQTILIVGIDSGGEISFEPGVMPLEEEDVDFCGLEDNTQLHVAFALAEKAFRPIFKNPSDAGAVVAYIQAGGEDVPDTEIDKVDGFILENFVSWRRKKTPVKECLEELEKALGPQRLSVDTFRKRLARIMKLDVNQQVGTKV